MKRHLQCAEQQVSRSNLTKYCACHAERLTYLIIITYETSFTMRGATGVTIQPHQILRLSRRKTRILNHHYILWNLIYNARSKCHDPTSPNTVPVTLACLVLITYETSFTMRGATGVTIQPHQILRLSRRKTHILSPHHIWNVIYSARSNRCHDPTSPNTAPATQNCIAKFQRKCPKTGETSFPMRGRSENDPTMIRPWSENNPTMKPTVRNPPRKWGYFSNSPRAFSIEKYNGFAPNLTFKPSPSAAPATKSDTSTSRSTAPATKSDTWTSPSTAPARKSNTWTSPSTAPATKSDTWPAPSTAPTTKSDTHRSSSCHMKPHLQCAEQPMSPSKLTKYCACHAKWPLNIWQKFAENRWNVISNAGTIREWSEHDPSMIRAWKRKPQPASQMRLLFELPRSIFYCKIQRFEPNLTFKHSPSAAPATKSNTWPSPNTAPTTKSNTWTSPNTAPTTKSNAWTSPSTAPATKSDTWPSPSTAPATKSDIWTSPTLLDSTLLDSTLLDSTLLDSTLLDSTLLDSSLLDLLYLILLYLTLLYLT